MALRSNIISITPKLLNVIAIRTTSKLPKMNLPEGLEKFRITGPPKTLRTTYTDEWTSAYEYIDPYREPVDEKYTDWEESNEEWKYVEKLFPPLYTPTPSTKGRTPSGWQSQPSVAPDLPYFVNRTSNWMLPVYLEIRNAGSRRMTLIKQIDGDIWSFKDDLKAFLQNKHDTVIPTQVNEPNGSVRFKGNYVEDIKEWMKTTGF